MGDIADDVMNGFQCSWCGVCFEKEHGYPVACKICWEEATAGFRSFDDEDDLAIESGVQEAIYPEL